jgi:ATP-dependent 26S proteasome regulatory subunit
MTTSLCPAQQRAFEGLRHGQRRAHLPPALLRSGRIELWLEVRLPNEEARADILRQHLSRRPPAIAEVDLPTMVAATEGFTGADLKRLADDGKNLLADDKAPGCPLRDPTDYFLDLP